MVMTIIAPKTNHKEFNPCFPEKGMKLFLKELSNTRGKVILLEATHTLLIHLFPEILGFPIVPSLPMLVALLPLR